MKQAYANKPLQAYFLMVQAENHCGFGGGQIDQLLKRVAKVAFNQDILKIFR